jgi:hypothetical protein
MPFRLAAAVAASLAVVLLTSGAASAQDDPFDGLELGEFPVLACAAAPGGDSQAWTLHEKSGSDLVVGRDCKPGRGAGGIITRTAVQNGNAPARARAWAQFAVPAGMEIKRLTWAGQMWRRDCAWTAQLYAVYPNGRRQRIYEKPCPGDKTARPNELTRVARFPSSSIGFNPNNSHNSGHYPVKIVQRVRCAQGPCKTSAIRARSGRLGPRADVRTYEAHAVVLDAQAPTVQITQATGLASGRWVRGDQAVHYAASDASGITRAAALVDGGEWAALEQDGQCYYAAKVSDKPPCPNASGALSVDTKKLPDGKHGLVVTAADPAQNVGRTALDLLTDNTAPGRVAIGVEGGAEWRNQQGFKVAWQNTPEAAAPIDAALYQTRKRGESDWSAVKTMAGDGIASLALEAPMGETELRLWRRDQAGNGADSDQTASEPVTLRYDPEVPQLGFAASPAGDPTKVLVDVSEKVSGLAGGQVELSPEGSGAWQALPTQLEGGRLAARIDDARLPAGRYNVRAQASDLAGNVGVTSATAAVTLPLRIQSALEGGAQKTKIVGKKVGRGAKRRTVRRRVTVLRPRARVAFGGHVTIAGQLTNRDGNPLADQEIQVITAAAAGDQVVAVLRTDAQGRYRYRAAGSASRTLRFLYPGTALILPAERQVRLRVPAATSFKVSRKRALNGQSVVFGGRVRSVPLPGAGKLVEIQVKQPGGEWTTFRTVRSDTQGRWRLRYRFRFVRCDSTYRLRARIPGEAGYPFHPGASRPRAVTVRGPQGGCGA